jgi:hypothetical protein
VVSPTFRCLVSRRIASGIDGFEPRRETVTRTDSKKTASGSQPVERATRPTLARGKGAAIDLQGSVLRSVPEDRGQAASGGWVIDVLAEEMAIAARQKLIDAVSEGW